MLLKLFSFIFLPLSLWSLTLEEKVGQLLMVRFEDLAEAKILVQEAKVGGFIYYAHNGLEIPSEVASLSQQLQNLSQIPLWISIDQEGGPVSRLGKEFPVFPGNRELGQSGSPAIAQENAYLLGLTLRSVGIQINFAPVVDISLDRKNSFMTARTYGNNQETVTAFAEQALLGYKKANILAVLKHFPGCGDVAADPHRSLPVLNKTRAELEQCEFYPFKQLASLSPGMMTTHLMVPALDPIHCATLSEPITGILRKEWGYEGLIFSDSLVMQGLLDQCPLIEEAAIGAFLAGCDLLLLGGKQLNYRANYQEQPSDVIIRIHQAIVNAVKSGRIPLSRIEESVERILKYKRMYIAE